MAQIPASHRDLANAFNSHSVICGNASSISHKLVLFYCIECGLKTVYLKRANLGSTEQLAPETKGLGHDLRGWAKELRLSAETIGSLKEFRLKKDNSTRFPVSEVHQAWRYCIPLNTDDETCLVNSLIHLKTWIKDNL